MVKTIGSFTVGKYKTRWREARVSDQEPSTGFCVWHHDPPPAVSRIYPDKPVIVFGFLEWQDEAGAWHGDWPYQVNATLRIDGPQSKSTTRPVGTGKGEVWFNFGKVMAGSYTYTLDFAGDTKFEDGAIMGALEILEVTEPMAWCIAALGAAPVLLVGSVIGFQELKKARVFS